MHFISFHYDVSALIKLSLQEVEDLIEVSQYHYDPVINTAGKQGGFLYGWHESFNCRDSREAVATVRLSARQAKLVCQMIELTKEEHPIREYWKKFNEVLTSLQEEYTRKNIN